MKKAAEVIIDCLEEKKMSQRQLATRMGEDVRLLNQQLNRRNDMKVGRFAEVLEHAGYRIEVVDNGGIQRVCQEFATQVIRTREPIGRFYTWEDGIYTGIDNSNGNAWTEDFKTEDECFKWLRNEPAIDASGNLHEI